jgi:hypothetical protein
MSEEFKVGADVSGAEAGAKKVAKSLQEIERQAKSLKGTLDQLGNGTAGLKALGKDADATLKQIERLKVAAGRGQSPNGQVGQIEGELAKLRQRVMDPAVLKPDRTPRSPGGRGGMAVGASPVSSMVGRRLLGMGVGLAAYGTASIISEGIQNDQEDAASAARVRRQLRNQGRMGEAGDVFRSSSALYDKTGTKSSEINKLIAAAMANGMNSKEASRAARLGLDVEATGEGNAMQFVKALNKASAEVPEELKRLASALGIETDHTTTLNGLLNSLQKNVGGLSEEVQKAKGGMGALGTAWERSKTALAQNLSLAMEGPYKKPVQTILNTLEGNTGKAEAVFNHEDHSADAVRSVKRNLKYGKITKEQAAAALHAVATASGSEADRYGTYYDAWKHPEQFGDNKAPQVEGGDKPIMPGGKSLRPAKNAPQGLVTVEHKFTFRNDPASPSQMRPRAM